MKIKSINIKNFRGLSNISFDLNNSTKAAVITGSNAVGKTTILEAIRFSKVLLSPSYEREAVETLQAMGLSTPNSNRIDVGELVKDPQEVMDIKSKFSLSDDEIQHLENNRDKWALNRLSREIGVPVNDGPSRIVQFLSSPDGQARLDKTKDSVTKAISDLKTSREVTLHLRYNPTDSSIRGMDFLGQDALSELQQKEDGTYGLLSYYPADRALPTGHVNIQLGSSDFLERQRSHVATPAKKYTRLKQHIISEFLSGDDRRAELERDFNQIFTHLLKNKSLGGIKLSRSSQVSILIREDKNEYDIDRMSSGEKGLLLTFLLMKHTTMKEGIILLDEPELHLNSSVCSELLSFILNHVIAPLNAQVIICTHSEEILASAYQNDACELLHLRTHNEITKIETKDRSEYAHALRDLGIEGMASFLSKGTLHVEGADDEDNLRTMFGELLKGFHIVEHGGRDKVEKQIKQLQDIESKNQLRNKHYFLFDQDRSPTNLTSSNMVKIAQWDRYCLENYLLDSDAIYDAIKNCKKTPDDSLSRGKIKSMLKEVALCQKKASVFKTVYSQFEPPNAGLRMHDIKSADNNYDNMTLNVEKRLNELQDWSKSFSLEQWKSDMKKLLTEKDAEVDNDWDVDWKKIASGKQIIEDLFKKTSLSRSLPQFKQEIAKQSKERNTEGYRLMKQIIKALLEEV